jgi:hypothetical protein
MTFLRNLALFFVLFLPLTLALSHGAGLLAGPAIVDGELTRTTPYPVPYWMTSVLVLVLPTVVLVLPLHWLRRRGLGSVAVAVTTSVSFVALVIAIWGAGFFSWPVIVFVALPALAYGSALKQARPR